MSSRKSGPSGYMVWLIVCAALFIALVLIRYAGLRPLLAGWDISALFAIQQHRPRALDGLLSLLTDLTTYITVTILSGILIRAAVLRSAAAARNGLLFFLAFGVAALLSTSLKHLVGRQRPFITHPGIEKLSTGGSPSFPSGHTTEAFAVAAILALLFPGRWFVWITYLWAIAVAYTRMALGVHYPSDVLGAALLGTAASLGVKLVWDQLAARRSSATAS